MVLCGRGVLCFCGVGYLVVCRVWWCCYSVVWFLLVFCFGLVCVCFFNFSYFEEGSGFVLKVMFLSGRIVFSYGGVIELVGRFSGIISKGVWFFGCRSFGLFKIVLC